MVQLAKFAEKRPVYWLVIALALIAAAALTLSDHSTLGLAKFLPLHTAMETFSIVVAMLIFTVGFNSYKEKASANLALLSCAFLAVGLLDFGHTLSYAGMPEFVTASGPEKAIFFWLAARMVAALALLAVALLPWQKEMAAVTQAGFLAAGLTLSAAIYWIILFHVDALPRVFTPGAGLTPLKRGMEYLLVGIYAATSLIFYRRKQVSQPYDVKLLLAAVAVMGLSELFFAAYTSVSDALSMLGHVYKIIAYYLLYRAIFAHGIRAPYQQLVESERSLRESEERFRTLFGSIQDAIFVLPVLPDGTPGKFIEVNEVACRMLGYTREELLGMTIADVDDPDAGVDPAPVIKRLIAGESVIFEQVLRTREGRLIAVEVNANPFTLAGKPVVMSLVRDISERRRMEREAHEAHQRQRDLSAHLQTAREDEKASIAREIHDDLGGTLTALKMDLYWLARKLPADPQAAPLLERTEAMSLLLDNAVAVTRRIITELRPTILDDLGLLAAIEWQAAQFGKRTGIECRVKCVEDIGRLGKQRSITLFRILQEALTNVMRHSGASRVEVEFKHSDEEIILSIGDNGCGLPEAHSVSPASYGMRGMFERVEHLGGKIKFDSQPGGGLTVTVTLPSQNSTLKEKP